MMHSPNARRLFVASCLALVVTAMTFAIRANIIGDLGKQFALSHTEMGWVAGTAFWGFTLAMIFGGPLCDILGMRALLAVAFIGHVAGVILTILATGFWSLFFSTLLVGVANGMVEAACNPLVTSLHPDNKTEKLNHFHVWFPGGIVIGGLVAYTFARLGLGWKAQMLSLLVPALVYGYLFFGQSFPKTERVSSGVSYRDMLKACISPLFIFMAIAMLFTAATELGTGQWITELLGNAGVPAILLLVFINGLMALGRRFAGPAIHRLSPPGVLFFSALFASLGLFLLSGAKGYWTFAAAAVFAVGVCYFWPTMLGFVAESVPKSGALGLSVMGGAGMLSVSLVLPLMGRIYDAQSHAQLTQGPTGLSAGAATLRIVSLIPAGLTIVFGLLWLFRRKKIAH